MDEQEYTVYWMVNVLARSEREAALKAQLLQKEADNNDPLSATVFYVRVFEVGDREALEESCDLVDLSANGPASAAGAV